MQRPMNVTPELLLSHAGSLRALARRLVVDESSADDLVQETWVRALERPPRTAERLGGWLAAVARSLAWKRHRTDERREARERARAETVVGGGSPGSAGSFGEPADEAAERRQALRLLTGAVLALEEPYQTAILLRFFEGLPPREVAQRLDVPLATAKSRIARGVERLRSRVGAELEDAGTTPARALAILLGPLGPGAGGGVPPDAPSAPDAGVTASTPFLGGTVGAKFAAAAAVLATVTLGTLCALALQDPVAPGTSVVPEVRTAAGERANARLVGAFHGPTSADEGGAEGRSRVPLAGALSPSVPDEAGAPRLDNDLFLVQGTVVDALDRPVAGARVYVAPLGHALNLAATTSADGTFETILRGSRASLDAAILVEGEGEACSGLRRVRLGRGANDLAFHLPAGDQPPGGSFRIRLDRGPGIPGDGDEGRFFTQLVLSTDHGHGTGLEELVAHPADPLARVLAAERRGCPGGRGPTVGHITMGTVQPSPGGLLPSPAGLEQKLALGLTLPTDEGPTHSVGGVVRDASGAPVPGAWIRATAAESCVETRADDAGAYLLEGLAPREWTLRAGGGDHGRAWEHPGALGGDLRWDPILERGRELHGHLLGPDGAALAGWSLEIQDATGPCSERPFADGTTTDPSGAFAVPNVPGRRLRALVRAPGDGDRHPVAVFEDLFAGPEPIRLTLGEDALDPGSLRLEIQGLRESGGPSPRVRVWNVAAGTGTWLGVAEDDGVAPGAMGPGALRYAAANLPAGNYEVEILAPEHPPVRLGPLLLHPGGLQDLGVVPLEAPGTVVFPVETVEEGDLEGVRFDLWQLRGDLRARLTTGVGAPPPPLALPAGRYELMVRPDRTEAPLGEEGDSPLSAPVAPAPVAPRALAFEVRTGEATRILIQADAPLPRLADASPRLAEVRPWILDWEAGADQAPGAARLDDTGCTVCHVPAVTDSPELSPMAPTPVGTSTEFLRLAPSWDSGGDGR